MKTGRRGRPAAEGGIAHGGTPSNFNLTYRPMCAPAVHEASQRTT